jgi:hypothetical protein
MKILFFSPPAKIRNHTSISKAPGIWSVDALNNFPGLFCCSAVLMVFCTSLFVHIQKQTSEVFEVHVDFEGGLELLFSRVKRYTLRLPSALSSSDGAASAGSAGSPASVAVVCEPGIHRPSSLQTLIVWLRDNLLVERSELFLVDGKL